jgi:hypothetical protein
MNFFLLVDNHSEEPALITGWENLLILVLNGPKFLKRSIAVAGFANLVVSGREQQPLQDKCKMASQADEEPQRPRTASKPVKLQSPGEGHRVQSLLQ